MSRECFVSQFFLCLSTIFLCPSLPPHPPPSLFGCLREMFGCLREMIRGVLLEVGVGGGLLWVMLPEAPEARSRGFFSQ